MAGETDRAQTVVILLDDTHVGHTCFTVDGTDHPQDVMAVAELTAEVAESAPMIHALLLASIRPGHGIASEPDLPDGDMDRWFELVELFDSVGVELLDWLVITPEGTASMREAVGLPERWRGGP